MQAGSPSQWVSRDRSAERRSIAVASLRAGEAADGTRVVPEPDWTMAVRPTWTYRVQELVRQRIALEDDPDKPLSANILGPYSSSFSRCFNAGYRGCILVGGGTGLTAALSVLRELVRRKNSKMRVPKYVWFVWSCKTTDDLLWLWDTLNELLLGAIDDETIKPGDWGPNDAMLDWLGIRISVTRPNNEVLDDLVGRPSTDGDAEPADAQVVRPAVQPVSPQPLRMGRAVSRFIERRKAREGELLQTARNVRDWLAHDDRLVRRSADDPASTLAGSFTAFASTSARRRTTTPG